MLAAHRILSSSLVALLLVGCDGGGVSGFSSGPTNVADTNPIGSGGGGNTGPGGFSGAGGGPGGTKNTVVSTTSAPGTVSVTAGASQTVSVTFTSSDGRSIHGLSLTSTTLPADWSGTDNYSCTLVGAGSSCVLNLTYSPTAAESGSLTVTYVYINNANQPITPGGTVTIPYVATAAPNNNVVATSAPTGQVVSSPGSSAQPVTVNFTTDDGNAGTNLALTTDLGSLPSGWTSKSSSFSCAIVSSGNGCQLVLSYLPKSTATGTLSLDYTYSDSMGTARTGTLNIPYSTTTDGTVVATAAPMGQVNAVAKTGNQAVNVTFTTDDGKAARNLLVLSDLTALPSGWTSSSSKFTCGSVSGGNACQLTLNYAPPAIASGTLSLNYGYLDAGGTYNVGSLNIPYAATTNDNVVGTAAPSGQIDAIVGSTSPTVAVTFATDDGRPATALALTTSLTSLPGGWTSSDSAFTCSGVNGGTTCQLPLTYTPTGADSGTLALAYQYVNDAGQTKTGTVDIPYRATTNNTVAATSSPTTLAVLIGTTTPVSVTFVTDDGNPASDLTVTSGLTPLPTGWSGTAATLSCPSVSTGTGCQLSFSYAPAAADSGTLALGYSYTNNSGMTKSGTMPIGYTATVPPPPGP
jgi:hypothetical protein